MKQLTLRLSDELHAELKALAQTAHRSMHAEILHRVTETLERRVDPLPAFSSEHSPDEQR